MVVPAIIGLALLVIIVYIAFKVLKNLIFGLILIVFVFFAAFLIIGSLPDLRSIPIIGRFIPQLPTSTGEVITILRNVFYRIDILSVSRDLQNNLLITIANRGKMEVSGFKVFVDGQSVDITNNPKDPLKSGEVATIQTNWNKGFSEVLVSTKQASTTYTAK